jgi:hypothetical protein
MAADPNKYKKNADIRPDTLVQTLTSVGSMILMFIGIIGLAMELFKDEGWLKTALAWLFDTTTHMMFIPVIAVVLWLLNRWFSAPGKEETKKSGNLPMYIMMGVGAYYVYRLVTTGGF